MPADWWKGDLRKTLEDIPLEVSDKEIMNYVKSTLNEFKKHREGKLDYAQKRD